MKGTVTKIECNCGFKDKDFFGHLTTKEEDIGPGHYKDDKLFHKDR